MAPCFLGAAARGLPLTEFGLAHAEGVAHARAAAGAFPAGKSVAV
jgi:hypothetical protein